MNQRIGAILLSGVGLFLGMNLQRAHALSKAFTFQGQLQQSGSPASGSCDFVFALWDALDGGNQIGANESETVALTAGVFTVQLNGSGQFGDNAFAGSDRWMEIAVRCPASSGDFVTLTPRQQVTATPYALLSQNNVGPSNTVLGQDALASNTDGFSNTALGSSALNQNTTGYYNVAVGPNALDENTEGFYNTAVGPSALDGNTTGYFNTAVGYSALNSGDMGYNTAVGAFALNQNTTGNSNTALGSLTLFQNTTGDQNIALGINALFSNTTGGSNTALGAYALDQNTEGYDNLAVGPYSLFQNITGNNNTALGPFALFQNETADNNVALGTNALYANTAGASNTALGEGALSQSTGSSNIGVGADAGANLTAGDFNIDIGNAGVDGDVNTIRIGSGDTHQQTFVAGIAGATSASGVAVFVNSDGQLGTATSSARFKEHIQDIGDASSGLMKLRPVQFQYKHEVDPSGLQQYGLVAEEVAKVYPALVQYDADGRPNTVRYHFINAMLLNEVQRQTQRITADQRQITDQAVQIADLRARLAAIEATLGPRAGR